MSSRSSTTTEAHNAASTLLDGQQQQQQAARSFAIDSGSYDVNLHHTVTKPPLQQPRSGLVSSRNNADNLINLDDKRNFHYQSSLATSSTSSYKNTTLNDKSSYNENKNNPLARINSRQVRFKSLLAHTTVINEGDENQSENTATTITHKDAQELIDLSRLQPISSTYCDILNQEDEDEDNNLRNLERHKRPNQHNNSATLTTTLSNNLYSDDNLINQEPERSSNFFDSDDEFKVNDNINDLNQSNAGDLQVGENTKSPSHHKLKNNRQRQQSFVGKLFENFRSITTDLTSKISSSGSAGASTYPYYSYDSEPDQQAGLSRKYRSSNSTPSSSSSSHSSQSKRHNYFSSERLFRGPYRYSRLGIVMALLKRLLSFLFQRSTLALFGAFLIHITLGTVYTLSNVNSYLTSYMRLHGTPNATYGGSMWLSSSYSVGQGLSMVLGGYLEKRFSARLACILGCLLHSLSIMSTSLSINHGQLAVLLTYGLLPGFGCGLAYMTPMSNGFGWFPHRRGLVAGFILAGFGIGTFVFNMAQTAYVNAENLSPLPEAKGYFTQESILKNVPHLFVFMGTIYACMQFIGCCLLFKPPSPNIAGDLSPNKEKFQDQRPLLMSSDEATNTNPLTQLTFKKALRTREFWVLFVVFGVTNQGVLFVNSMLKEYAQLFINDDMYLAWTGSMASIANSLGRLAWGMAIDRYSFTQCFTAITTIFGALMFLMPFKFILSSKLLYLLCTLGVFGSFSGWMSTYPVHLSRVFGVKNSGMVYGLIFVSQSIGGIMTAFGAHYLIENFTRFVPFFMVTFLEAFGLAVYHLFYFK